MAIQSVTTPSSVQRAERPTLESALNPQNTMADFDLNIPPGLDPANAGQSLFLQSALNRLNQVTPRGSMQYSGPGRSTAELTLTPEEQNLFGQRQGVQSQALTSALSNLTEVGDRTRAEEAMFERMTNLYDSPKRRAIDDFNREMANRGIPVGSEAYRNAYSQRVSEPWEKIYRTASLASVQEGRKEQDAAVNRAKLLAGLYGGPATTKDFYAPGQVDALAATNALMQKQIAENQAQATKDASRLSGISQVGSAVLGAIPSILTMSTSKDTVLSAIWKWAKGDTAKVMDAQKFFDSAGIPVNSSVNVLASSGTQQALSNAIQAAPAPLSPTTTGMQNLLQPGAVEGASGGIGPTGGLGESLTQSFDPYYVPGQVSTDPTMSAIQQWQTGEEAISPIAESFTANPDISSLNWGTDPSSFVSQAAPASPGMLSAVNPYAQITGEGFSISPYAAFSEGGALGGAGEFTAAQIATAEAASMPGMLGPYTGAAALAIPAALIAFGSAQTKRKKAEKAAEYTRNLIGSMPVNFVPGHTTMAGNNRVTPEIYNASGAFDTIDKMTGLGRIFEHDPNLSVMGGDTLSELGQEFLDKAGISWTHPDEDVRNMGMKWMGKQNVYSRLIPETENIFLAAIRGDITREQAEDSISEKVNNFMAANPTIQQLRSINQKIDNIVNSGDYRMGEIPDSTINDLVQKRNAIIAGDIPENWQDVTSFKTQEDQAKQTPQIDQFGSPVMWNEYLQKWEGVNLDDSDTLENYIAHMPWNQLYGAERERKLDQEVQG